MAHVLLRASRLGLLAGLFLGLSLSASAQTATKSPGETGFGELEEPTKVINQRLKDAWESAKLTPAPRCTDYEFIRRASLDIIGRIAKYEEIQQFMKDPPSVRRQLLVERLLKSPEYVDNWSTLWTFWLMTRTGQRLYKDQIHLWLHDEVFDNEEKKETNIRDMWEKLITATGATNDNGAVNFLLANVGESTAGTGRNQMPNDALLKKSGQFEWTPVTARTIRLCLGYQIQCTQCHDHPFNADWKQKNFWGVNAFFRQTQRIGAPAMQKKKGMPATKMELTDNADYNVSGIVFYEKRNGVFLPSDAVFLDGTRLPKKSQLTRRQELAKFILNHKNFSRAYVNRMWAHFFSRGVNAKPAFDDFGEHNEVVHEDLLNDVSEAFVKGSYDPKKLIRWITASDAYNLKCQANKSNDTPENEVHFSRQMLKPMSPEQLYESIMAATRRKTDEKTREDWMRRLTSNFGDDEGNETTFNGTVVQALLMMNGQDTNQAISRTSGTVEMALKKNKAKDIMDFLFLSTLNRPATAKEYNQIAAKMRIAGKEADPAGPLQDVFWALLNCNEFFLNH